MNVNLWQRVQSLSRERLIEVGRIYEDADIPIDIRHYLASWIEVKISELDGWSFLKELKLQITTLPFFVRERLEFINKNKNNWEEYEKNPELLLDKFKQCYMQEVHLIQLEDSELLMDLSSSSSSSDETMDSEQSSPFSSSSSEDGIGMLSPQPKPKTLTTDNPKMISLLKFRSKDVDEILKLLYKHHEQFYKELDLYKSSAENAFEYEDLNGVPETAISLNGLHFDTFQPIQSKDQLSINIKRLAHSIWNTSVHLQETFRSILNDLKHLVHDYLGLDIKIWKHEQERSIIGFPMNKRIDDIQQTSEDLAEIIYVFREQLIRVLGFKSIVLNGSEIPGNLQCILNDGTILLSQLIQMTFLIEIQPLPIIHTGSSFYMTSNKKPMTVGSLIAHKLNPRMIRTNVDVNLISSSTAKEIHDDQPQHINLETINDLSLVNMKNNIVPLQYSHPERPHLSAQFPNISLNLNNSRRKGHCNSELVTDEKCFLLFTSKITLADDITIHVWTMSGPVLIITHVSQFPKAWATILWEYGISRDSDTEDNNVEVSTWPQILSCLDAFFFNLIGINLRDDYKQFLTSKATNPKTGKQIETLKELSKDDMNGRNCSFWNWFYQSVKLTEAFFKDEFKSCPKIGFIGKEEAEMLLNDCKPWTFLLRFSDSFPGAISIVCSTDTKGDVCSLNPFNKDALKQRSLSGKISDLVQLKYVYPDIPKDEIFTTDTSEQRAGYEPFVYTIPRLNMKVLPIPNLDVEIDELLRCLEKVDNDGNGFYS